MRLVVIGAYSLDVLQEQVIACFSDVPSLPRTTITTTTEDLIDDCTATTASKESSDSTTTTEYKNFSWDENEQSSSPMTELGMPFTKQSLYDRVFYVAPVGERHVLSVTWQIPSQIGSWKSKPCDYISHLIGHEAKGSFLASLKAKSWATGCCAGVGSEGYEVCAET